MIILTKQFQFICFANISKYLQLYTYTYKARKFEEAIELPEFTSMISNNIKLSRQFKVNI